MEVVDDNALLIFIKNPEKGKVKTRLAQTVGEDKALKIYKALLSHTRNIAEALPVHRYLFYSQYINEADEWSTTHFEKRLQIEADLGSKMAVAFQQVLAKHSKAIIIGSDCASLTPEIVYSAFDKLNKFPYVIGPAEDGGYYLLGMREFTPTLFRDIAWSTESVLPTTLQKIKNLNKDYFLLPILSDIDYESDWEKHGWDLD